MVQSSRFDALAVKAKAIYKEMILFFFALPLLAALYALDHFYYLPKVEKEHKAFEAEQQRCKDGLETASKIGSKHTQYEIKYGSLKNCRWGATIG